MDSEQIAWRPLSAIINYLVDIVVRAQYILKKVDFLLHDPFLPSQPVLAVLIFLEQVSCPQEHALQVLRVPIVLPVRLLRVPRGLVVGNALLVRRVVSAQWSGLGIRQMRRAVSCACVLFFGFELLLALKVLMLVACWGFAALGRGA